MKYVVGVDGGGSKTLALILDHQGKAAGLGSSGCGNHQVRGLEPAVAEIEKAVKTALHQAALIPQDVQMGFFCLSGADLKDDYVMLSRAMAALNLADHVIVKNDTMAALRASITRSWGVAVICGSGFNAAARSPAGMEIVFPGLGFISGDWGGGDQLSAEIIRLVMRAWDGRGEKTLLTNLVLSHYGVTSEEVLLEDLYHEKISQQELLQLVPLLFEAAEASDEPARKLIIQMGDEVAAAANALIKRLSMQEKDVEVGLAGGVFRGNGPLLVETAARGIRRLAPAARILRTRYEPVVGAALLALETAGVTIDKDIYTELERTLPASLKQ